jgi:hypothetical protein
MTRVFLDARRLAMPWLPELHAQSDVLRWMAEVVLRDTQTILADAPEGGLSGFAALRLHVFQRNARARAFYEHRGFRVDALRDGSQNEEREPDAVYVWAPPFTPPEKSIRRGV